MSSADYHQTVADYYDEEAASFEGRANDNHVLMQLRDAFRAVVLEGDTDVLLEIGYGPGLDMVWFAEENPERSVIGLDITPEFHAIVERKSMAYSNMKAHLGGPLEIPEHIPPASVDTVYVFFGALNTCAELDVAIERMTACLKPGGRVVATFVNKWYAFDLLWNFITLRPTKAVARLRKVWGGYSPTRFLPSRCYSARQLHRLFRPHVKRERRRGYCITHPAWYRHHWAPKGSVRGRCFQALDALLQYTPFWNCGEYSLYVYRKPS